MVTNGAYQFSKMLGAIFYYLISGLKNNFDFYNSEKFNTRNIWTGYVIQLTFMAIGIYLIIHFNT